MLRHHAELLKSEITTLEFGIDHYLAILNAFIYLSFDILKSHLFRNIYSNLLLVFFPFTLNTYVCIFF